MVKLSKTQQDVVDKMQSGWELGVSMGSETRCWLQKGRLGRGGETKTVHYNTFWSLWNKEIIVLVGLKYPLRRYKLVEKTDEKL